MASSISPNILDQPVMPPPSGQVSNLVDPPSIASGLYITTGICLSLIVLFAALRLYAKFRILKKKTWDDGQFQCGACFPIFASCSADYSHSHMCPWNCEEIPHDNMLKLRTCHIDRRYKLHLRNDSRYY